METMVRCVECGYDNNPQYRFCGMCGVTLRPPEAARDAQDSSGNHSSDPVEPVSGPSFLGLAGDNSPGAEYLLEDTSSEGHAKLFAFLVIIIAAAAFLGWRWHHYGYILPKNGIAAITSKNQNAPASAAGENGQIPPGAENASATPTPGSTAENTSAQNSSPAIEVLDNQPSVNGQPANSVGTTAASGQGSTEQGSTDQAATENESATENTAQAQDNGTGGNQETPPAAALHNSEHAAAGDSAAKTPASVGTSSSSSSFEKTAKAAAPKAAHGQSAARTKPAQAATTPEQSESEALAVQGERYLYGTGVAQNCDRAQRSLLSAASRGSAHAETLLGAMYATGHCATRNLPTAYRWFARALHQEPSNSRISADLEVLWKQMTPDERQLATKAE